MLEYFGELFYVLLDSTQFIHLDEGVKTLHIIILTAIVLEVVFKMYTHDASTDLQ